MKIIPDFKKKLLQWSLVITILNIILMMYEIKIILDYAQVNIILNFYKIIPHYIQYITMWLLSSLLNILEYVNH